jgi:hypothetical protein
MDPRGIAYSVWLRWVESTSGNGDYFPVTDLDSLGCFLPLAFSRLRRTSVIKFRGEDCLSPTTILSEARLSMCLGDDRDAFEDLGEFLTSQNSSICLLSSSAFLKCFSSSVFY